MSEFRRRLMRNNKNYILVSTTASQYIDTGINITGYMEIEMTCILPSSNNTKEYILFGDKTDANNVISIGVDADSNIYYQFGNYMNSIRYVVNKDVEYNFKININGCYINNELIGKIQGNILTKTAKSIYLFGRRLNESLDEPRVVGIRKFIVREFDTIIMNLKATKDSNNIPCMIDDIQKKYYYNINPNGANFDIYEIL